MKKGDRLLFLKLRDIEKVACPLFSCSVCFGDPNSPLAKGALAGVLFLGGVVTVVLAWIGITAWVWARRARRFAPPA